MPSRLIKDSIHVSEKVNAMTDFQFRLWINLITYVDDYGRGDARAAVIKGACFPLRERISNKDIDAALAGLAGIGCVGLYEVDGKPYLYFPNWEKHQTIRNKRSKYPEPQGNEIDLQANASKCKQMSANVPVIQSESESISESKLKAQECADRTPLEIALDDFAAARKAMKKPLTDKARELTISKLEELAPGDEAMQVAILNQSIQRGWQGVFALKADERAKTNAKHWWDDPAKALEHDDTEWLVRMLEKQKAEK